jgi:hypothetical protein
MVIAGAEGDCNEAFGVVKLDPGGKPDLDGFAAQMMRATGSPAASPRHTTDGVLMLGAYGWAFVKPIRKLYYNLTITVVSVVVAIVVGGLEVLNLIGDQLRLTDGAFISSTKMAMMIATTASVKPLSHCPPSGLD